MYMCTYTHIYVHTYIHMCVYMCRHIHTYIHASIYTCTHILCMHACVYTRIHTHICCQTCVCRLTQTHTSIQYVDRSERRKGPRGDTSGPARRLSAAACNGSPNGKQRPGGPTHAGADTRGLQRGRSPPECQGAGGPDTGEARILRSFAGIFRGQCPGRRGGARQSAVRGRLDAGGQ